MAQRADVLLVLEGDLEVAVVTTLLGAGIADVRRRCADAAEAMGVASAGIGDLAVVDAALVGPAARDDIRQAGLDVIVVAAPGEDPGQPGHVARDADAIATAVVAQQTGRTMPVEAPVPAASGDAKDQVTARSGEPSEATMPPEPPDPQGDAPGVPTSPLEIGGLSGAELAAFLPPDPFLEGDAKDSGTQLDQPESGADQAGDPGLAAVPEPRPAEGAAPAASAAPGRKRYPSRAEMRRRRAEQAASAGTDGPPHPAEAAPAVAAQLTPASADPAIDRPAEPSASSGLSLPPHNPAAAAAAPEPIPTPAPAGTQDPQVPDPGRAHLAVTIAGPAGAPGRSTICLALAREAAGRGLRVLAIDADTVAPSLVYLLGLPDEASGVAAATVQARHGSLDAIALGDLVLPTPWGFDVLTGISDASRWREVPGSGLEGVIAVAREAYDLVLIDTAGPVEGDNPQAAYFGPGRDDARGAAIDAADRVVVVGAGDPLGMRRVVTYMRSLGGDDPLVVITRVDSVSGGVGAERGVRHLMSRYATVADCVLVRRAADAAAAAVLAGRPLADRDVGGDIASLADRLLGPAASVTPRVGLWQRLRGR
ncbi:MAG: ParA family protein [Actinomycetaceae bacterium]|nr:ParA family protein [Actinomycetaceae bacterium]MDU0969691.1 ParA family protein [Actinomycetaceae bacterium]